ncbi:MAG: Fic family protein [candidate division Zixibacteria bacterium]|nr:Fic family protein [candidate division Zixibacteria bacterium]MDH3937602.1 Fic family protein [candidate division Zixibacteria bacterium]MDH4034515.1 Fic family protein [candidate division Zixibacteria bacterium]
MEVFKLTKPDISANTDKVLDRILKGEDFSKFIESTSRPEYLFWDKAKYKSRPQGVSAGEFWSLIKLFRQHSPNRTNTIIRDERDTPFSWQPLPGQDYFLHEIDMELGGALMANVIDDDATRQRFITRGIIEEAIASSQLEGANTTRRVAKQMLLEKRKPANKSERMIINNYNAMRAVESQLGKKTLSIETLLDLHVMLTKDTIDDSLVGRFRRDKDEIVVCDAATNIVYHVPPSERFMKKEIKRFIQYANDTSKEVQFVHPLIKAILIHFWMGFLHPFADGNGRMARTLFYWYLLKNNYWAFSYLPVSKVIKNSPAQYRDAYIYSEQDDNDLTYFIDYNFRRITQAKRDFETYCKRKEIQNRKMAGIARAKYNLNDRQIQLLRYLHKNSSASTAIKTYAQIHGVSRPTSRKDLEQLEQLGLLSSTKLGRDRPFRGTKAISELF